MKKYLIVLSFIMLSSSSFAFMSGIDESRDSQGELVFIGAHIPLAPAGMMNAGYLKITNSSDDDIEFEKFTSPVYDSVMVHDTKHDGDIAKMTHVDALIVPANSTIELKPGGMHLMLMGPRRDINAGEEILMIGLGLNGKRYMVKFLVVDPRVESHHH